MKLLVHVLVKSQKNWEISTKVREQGIQTMRRMFSLQGLKVFTRAAPHTYPYRLRAAARTGKVLRARKKVGGEFGEGDSMETLRREAHRLEAELEASEK